MHRTRISVGVEIQEVEKKEKKLKIHQISRAVILKTVSIADFII